jgi:terminase small subunit / prophage DNA-packing protein
MGKIVNQSELAALIGKSDVTIWEWQKEGLPMQSRGENGQANKYDTERVIDWLVQRAVLKVRDESQRDRLTRLQADKLEQDLAMSNNVLVPVDQVQPIWKARVISAAAFLLSQSSRMAALLESAPGMEGKREILKIEHGIFLSKLGSNGKLIQAEVDDVLKKIGELEAAALMVRLQNIGESDVGPDSRNSA